MAKTFSNEQLVGNNSIAAVIIRVTPKSLCRKEVFFKLINFGLGWLKGDGKIQ